MAGALVLLALGLGLGIGSCAPGADETLAYSVKSQVPRWAKQEGFGRNRVAVAGANLFAVSGCTNCHTYLGSGSSNLGAPNLTAEGAKGRGIRFQVAHLRCPSCVSPGSPMPPFRALGPANLRRLAVFLEASKGRK
jgi:mono/diheme cytochrome c family protein